MLDIVFLLAMLKKVVLLVFFCGKQDTFFDEYKVQKNRVYLKQKSFVTL